MLHTPSLPPCFGTAFQCGQSQPLFLLLRAAPYLGPPAQPVPTIEVVRNAPAMIMVMRERFLCIFIPYQRDTGKCNCQHCPVKDPGESSLMTLRTGLFWPLLPPP